MTTFVGRLGALGTANRIAWEINEQATETNPNPEIIGLRTRKSEWNYSFQRASWQWQCKVIQDSLWFWIARCGFRTRYHLNLDLEFPVVSGITDSKVQDSGYHTKIFPGFRNPNYLILGGSLYVSGKLPTYPSLKVTCCLKWEVSVDVGSGEGYVGSFPETFNDHMGQFCRYHVPL